MKQRSSVEKAEWSETRAGSYQAMAENIAFRARVQLQVRGLEVSVLEDGVETLLLVSTATNRLWFEAWKALSARFPSLARR
jgi:hypothetical protein